MGEGLKPKSGKAFVYSDCWVEDSRLVSLNALDAAERGARIVTRTRLLDAERKAGGWTARIEDAAGVRTVSAKVLVNAAGPWVGDILAKVPDARGDRGVRLIKGSHIVVPKLYRGEHAFLLQNPDKRVVFAIPYEGDFTLVGTTDEAWEGEPGRARITAAETDYLCETISRYFATQITAADVVWSYAGIRPLYDNHAANASAVTRDYVLDLDAGEGRAPMLSIFGGKITTYRKLAEHAMRELAPFFPASGPAWTAGAVLPGGDIADLDFDRFVKDLTGNRLGLPPALLRRLARAYGTRVQALLGSALTTQDLGRDFGGGLYQAEVDYLVDEEWARAAEDILFRRSKLGLHVPAQTATDLDAYLQTRLAGRSGDAGFAAAGGSDTAAQLPLRETASAMAR
jgi:glycerol-3-phosphate dehydrogenase